MYRYKPGIHAIQMGKSSKRKEKGAEYGQEEDKISLSRLRI
jgi:hypothetical protein